jgi:GNAT superfamily N-acetyltransferase
VSATTVTIEAYDAATAPEAVVRAAFELMQAEDAELRPEDPPYTWEVFEGLHRIDSPDERYLRWLATEGDGRPVGVAMAELPTVTNTRIARVELYVLPEARGRGVGRALLRTLTAAVAAEGRTHVRTHIVADTSGERLAAALGATVGRTNRKSRMRLDLVDRSMLEGWVARAEREATGYSLLGFDRHCPDEWLEEYMRVKEMMNTAPRGDLEMDDWVWTPEATRAEEAALAAARLERWNLFVRHDATGVFAGFTEVVVTDAHPEHAWQGGTAVRPEHRNRGIGRWLKAAMALRLLDERPSTRAVDTENAFSNQAMLDINVAMGFELVKTVNDWQVPVATLEARA